MWTKFFVPAFLGVISMLASGQSGFAQTSLSSVFQLPDSAVSFSIDQFYSVILNHHPIVKQANLLGETARQEIRLARGSFDPKLEFLLERKEFQDKTYYDLRDGLLYFPTRSPLVPKLGYERNAGERLDPSLSIPGDVQYFAGVSVPLGRGLITDERRTSLRQAEVFQQIAEAEQIKAINKILLQAAKHYWQWYHAYYQYRLLQQGARLAEDIFKRVRVNHEFGEASPLDTVQAKITLQTRLVEQQEALLQFMNSGIEVSNYLWDESTQPVQLSPRFTPVLDRKEIPLDIQTLSALTDQAKTSHPELIKYRNKVTQLEADRQLAKEFLKPRLDLNYTLLAQPNTDRFISPTNDYKMGLDFSMPLFLRKERSKLALTKIKIQSTEWEQDQVEREIVNEISVTFNEITNTSVIMRQQTEMVALYDRLLAGELMNLQNGESDLFKINIQQDKLIQSQSKLLKLTSEFEKMKAHLYWAAGTRKLGMP